MIYKNGNGIAFLNQKAFDAYLKEKKGITILQTSDMLGGMTHACIQDTQSTVSGQNWLGGLAVVHPVYPFAFTFPDGITKSPAALSSRLEPIYS